MVKKAKLVSMSGLKLLKLVGILLLAILPLLWLPVKASAGG